MKAIGREIGVVAGQWRERRFEEPIARQPTGRARSAKGELFAYFSVFGARPAATSSPAGLTAAPVGLHSLHDAASTRLSDELRHRVTSAYFQDPSRSVTASLRHALGELNSSLHAANSVHPSQVRRYAAASCAVVREGELFIAVSGPAVVYVVEGSEVQVLADSELLETSALLGQTSDASIELVNRTTTGPVSIVLGSGSLAEAAPEAALRRALSSSSQSSGTQREPVEALREALGSRASAADLTFVFVDVDGANPRWSAESPPAGGVRQPFPVGRSPELDRQTAAGETVRVDPIGSPKPARSAAAEAVLREIDSQEAILKGRRTQPRRTLPRIPLLAVLALAAVLLVYAVPVRLFLDYQIGQYQRELVQQAEAKELAARSATDSAARVRLLVEAGNLASQAAQANAGDVAAADLSKRIQTQLDALTNAIRLPEPSRLLALDGQPGKLVLGASDLFVLDRSAERVSRYPLEANRLGVQTTASPVVFRKGDRLGELEIGSPRQLLWMPGGSGRIEGFLVLDSGGTLFEWDPSRGGLKVARQSTDSRHALLIAGYGGTLYVLDSVDDKLEWRPPSSGVYDRAAYPYFQPDVDASVADVVSFAVGEDLFVLRKSGQIDRFALGKPVGFAGSPPDRQLGSDSSLMATTKGVYAFDPTNRRIVQFGRDGTYRRQFVLEGREALVDVALDESRGLIYALGKQGIYLYRSAELSATPSGPTPQATPAVTPTTAPARAPTATPARTPVPSPAATPTIRR